MLGSGWGELGGRKSPVARECVAAVGGESFFLPSAILFCVFSLAVSLLLLFSFVCSSVKLPLSLPTSFCLFLSILLCTPAGGGVAMWPFCCRLQPNYNNHRARSRIKILWQMVICFLLDYFSIASHFSVEAPLFNLFSVLFTLPIKTVQPTPKKLLVISYSFFFCYWSHRRQK